jgi:arsenate reductase
MKILILCTGNSARSQMAHGILQNLNADLYVHSAGTKPTVRVHPMAVEVMHDLGIDISHHVPMQVETYLKERWDYVITVCDCANETCPVFIGDVRHRLHIGFEDPARNYENQEEERQGFIKIRDKIVLELFRFNARTFKY